MALHGLSGSTELIGIASIFAVVPKPTGSSVFCALVRVKGLPVPGHLQKKRATTSSLSSTHLVGWRWGLLKVGSYFDTFSPILTFTMEV